MTVTEVFFKAEPPDDENETEKLKMPHIFFPLGLWVAGLFLALVFLLAEIIHYRLLRKSKRNVPMLMMEESTPQSEVEHNSDLEDIEDNKL